MFGNLLDVAEHIAAKLHHAQLNTFDAMHKRIHRQPNRLQNPRDISKCLYRTVKNNNDWSSLTGPACSKWGTYQLSLAASPPNSSLGTFQLRVIPWQNVFHTRTTNCVVQHICGPAVPTQICRMSALPDSRDSWLCRSRVFGTDSMLNSIFSLAQCESW